MTKKRLKAKAEESLGYLDEVRRSYNHRNIYCVNVKRYGDFMDVEDLAQKYPKKLKEAIVEEFDEKLTNDIYWSWLGHEGQYFCEDFLTGCTVSSAKHYQEQRELVNANKDTNYPTIDKKKTINTKLAIIDKMEKKDRKIEKHLSYIDIDSAGLYGRMGGWFGVRSEVADGLENLIGDINNGNTIDEIYANNCITEMFEEVEAIEWVLNEADKFNKGLNFEEELKFRIGEFVNEEKVRLQQEKEIKTAKTLATKYNLLVVRAV